MEQTKNPGNIENAKLINVTEEIVNGLVSFTLHGPGYPTFCGCKKCELDIIAITLNHLDNHFVTMKEDRDRAYAILKTPESIAEIDKHIIHAIHVVGKNPRH